MVVDTLIATKTESMVQKAGGHEDFLTALLFGGKNEENRIVHIFSTPGMHLSDEP